MARITSIGLKKRKYVVSDPSDSPFAAADAAASAAAATASASASPAVAAAPAAVEAAAAPATGPSKPPKAAKPPLLGPDGEPLPKKHKKQHRGTRGKKHSQPEKASATLAQLQAAAALAAAAPPAASSSSLATPPAPPPSAVRPPKGMTGANASIGSKADGGWGARSGTGPVQPPTFNADGRKTMAGLEGPKPNESQVGYEARVAAREARKAGIKGGKGDAAAARALASEKRRLDRIAEREASTTCFACRAQGHSAKDCPNQLDGAVEAAGVRSMQGRDAVNICYRCGSTSHTLKACPRPADPLKPMPHASCFVCLQKGHLASRCPANGAKGIYPDGGCCGLCKGTDHLSRDCELRKNDRLIQHTLLPPSRPEPTGFFDDSAFAQNVPFVHPSRGAPVKAGADEDDFHALKRTRDVVEREERRDELLQAGAARKVAPVGGAGAKAKKAKVVSF